MDPDNPSQHRHRSTPQAVTDSVPVPSQVGHGRGISPPPSTRDFDDADESHLIRGYD